MQLLVPRTNACEESSKIILTKKDVYSIKTSDAFKEVILDKNNKPITIDYKMEKSKSFSLIKIWRIELPLEESIYSHEVFLGLEI